MAVVVERVDRRQAEGVRSAVGGSMSKTYQRNLEGNAIGQYWITPPELYAELNSEFHFDFDPCPYPYQREGIEIEWGQSRYVNPPYRKKDAINGHGPTAFVRKAIEENKKGKQVVLIIPVQSYVNMLVEAGAELRSMGRVKWIDAISKRPCTRPSNVALFILRRNDNDKI
jgi:hypothetical protein